MVVVAGAVAAVDWAGFGIGLVMLLQAALAWL